MFNSKQPSMPVPPEAYTVPRPITVKDRELYYNATGRIMPDTDVRAWCVANNIWSKSDDRVTGSECKDIMRGNGGSTSYYDLPPTALVLGDIIRYKKMEHGIGEAFCALYRLNDNGERLRNLKKAQYYIDAEIEHLEN